MTKSDHIRAIASEHPDWTTRQIADAMDDGTGTSYVRVVLRQRVGGRSSAADKRYEARNPDYKSRQVRGCLRRRYYAVPPDERRAIRSVAYRHARAQGKTPYEGAAAGASAIYRQGGRLLREAKERA